MLHKWLVRYEIYADSKLEVTDIMDFESQSEEYISTGVVEEKLKNYYSEKFQGKEISVRYNASPMKGL